MDREINERAVISTGAQRQEVFHNDSTAAKLSTSMLSMCVYLHMSTSICLDKREKETQKWKIH